MSHEPITVYHNPRCSKSRRVVEILTTKGVEFTLYEYLAERPALAELQRVMDALAIDDPRDMMPTFRGIGRWFLGRSRRHPDVTRRTLADRPRAV